MFEAGIEATAWARTSTLRLRLPLHKWQVPYDNVILQSNSKTSKFKRSHKIKHGVLFSRSSISLLIMFNTDNVLIVAVCHCDCAWRIETCHGSSTVDTRVDTTVDRNACVDSLLLTILNIDQWTVSIADHGMTERQCVAVLWVMTCLTWQLVIVLRF